MSQPGGLSRWLGAFFGLFLGVVVLLCAAGSVSLLVAPPEKNAMLGVAIGIVMLSGCVWMLDKCVRLVINKPSRDGLFSPLALQALAWVFLVMPVVGLFTGYYRRTGVMALFQAVVYVMVFFGLRALARERSSGTWVDPEDPLFAEALQRARASTQTLRELFKVRPEDVGVKYPFTTDRGVVEHVWGRLLALGSDEMRVSIETPPLAHDGSVPESLTVPLDALEDWHVVLPDGGIRGNFTTRAEIAIRRRRGERLPKQIAALEGRLVDQ